MVSSFQPHKPLLLTLLLSACTHAAPRTALVKEAWGDVTANGDPVGPGDVVRDGDVIAVDNGRVELELAELGKLRIFSKTRVDFNLSQIDGKRAFTVRLILGRIWAQVLPLVGDDTYQVETHNAVAGVRGTEFIVDASDDESEVRVMSGEVAVHNHAAPEKVQRVHAGQRSRVRQSESPAVAEPYDSNRDRAQWDDLKHGAREIKQGFKQGGRAIRDGAREVGHKIKSIFKR